MAAGKNTSTIDINVFENHVRNALEDAQTRAGDGNISAGLALRSVLAMARETSSKAFQKIADLMEIKVEPQPDVKTDINTVSFDAMLAQSYENARRYISSNTIWGRHFITIALFCTNDPSLNALAEEVGKTVALLQDEWFKFVMEDPGPTDLEQWKEWWKTIPEKLPDESQPSVDDTRNFWIFQATPKRFNMRTRIVTDKEDRWLANQFHTEIKKGDIVYFWQSGSKRGLYGWGEIISEGSFVFEGDGKNSVRVVYKSRFDEPILFEKIAEIEVMQDHRLLKPKAQGTNFKVNYEQAYELNKLIPGEPKPPPPPGFEKSFELKFRPFSDCWTTEDKLGYTFYAEAIANAILNRKLKPPISISIQAPWGQGKTSLMKMIQERLDPESRKAGSEYKKSATFGDMLKWYRDEKKKKQSTLNMLGVGSGNIKSIPTIWFNPLYYHNNKQVWAGLAHAILDQLSSRPKINREKFWFLLQYHRLNMDAILKDMRWFVFDKFVPFIIFYLLLIVALFFIGKDVSDILAKATKLDFLKSLHPAVIPPVLALLHWIGWDKLRIKSWNLQDKFETYVSEPDYESKQGFLWLVDRDMDKALELLVGDQPITIFIDDLDRCQPDVVCDVIFALNQFMSVSGRNIYFIIGMDSNMVAEALEKAHSQNKNQDNQENDFGWRFLEKFIQVPFFIPRLSSSTTKTYLASFIGDVKTELEAEEATYEKANRMVQEAKTSSQITEAMSVLSDSLDDEKKQEIIEFASERLQQILDDPESDEIELLVETAIRDIPFNPRSIKRFVNIARLLITVRTSSGKKVLSKEHGRKLIINAAHMLLNWPQIMSWLQMIPADQDIGNQDEKDLRNVVINNINNIAQRSTDFMQWKKEVNNQFGEDGKVLENEPFYRFLKKICQTDQNIVAVFESGMC